MIDPTTHRTMSERSYHGATSRSPIYVYIPPTPTYKKHTVTEQWPSACYRFRSVPPYSLPLFFLSPTEEPAKAGTCARDRRVLQQLALNGKSVRSWCDGSSERSFMVDLMSYFSFQPVLHDWCNKGRGMCYPLCGMVHIQEPLLLIGKSSLCGGSGFSFSLPEWSDAI